MRTLGVEEEFLLVDATGSVSPLAERVFREAAKRHIRTPDGEPVAVSELKREQAELVSAPCQDLAELRSDLAARRRRVQEAAAGIGASAAAMATSPQRAGSATTADERYERMVDEFGLIGRRQLTCGTHIHVSIDSRSQGVAVIDRIRPWLHVLLALSSNSPFWDGEDTGYASWRTILWGQWPSAGPVEAFRDEGGYDLTVSQLLATGTLLDEAMLYFDARLSANYPTVEIRVADACTHLDDTLAIAALCRALVDTAADDYDRGVPPLHVRVDLLRAATWRAAKSGMTGDLVDLRVPQAVAAWTLAAQLLEHVGPALARSGDYQYVADAFNRLRTSGTGAQMQRLAYSRRDDLADVLQDVITRSHI